MSATVRIPTPLRSLTGGSAEVTVSPGPLSAVLTELDTSFPGLGARVLDESGALRRFVNVYVGDDDVRFIGGLEAEIPEGARISIIPAVAGG